MSSRTPDPTAVLTLEALQLVDAIARRGSFAGAAAELGRVPSAITYTVRKLEDDLDVLLFDRRGYRAQLTAAGEELLREGRNLLAAADELTRRVQRVADGWERELRIALDTVIAFERLLPLIEAFCGTAPTQLRIAHEVLRGTWDALLSGRADLAIGAAYEGPQQARVGAGYKTFPLARMAMVFAVAPSHPLASADEPLSLTQLRQHRQVVVGDTSRRLAPRDVGLVGTSDVLTVPSMQAKVQAQMTGLGVGFVPESLARSAIKRGALVVKATEGVRPQGQGRPTSQVAWRSDARGKALAWWLEELRKPARRAALVA